MRQKESSIDREIREALEVMPSPDFAARVRMRIAREPVPSAWFSPRPVRIAVALATAVVIAALTLRPHEPNATRSAEVVLPASKASSQALVVPRFSPAITAPAGISQASRRPRGSRPARSRHRDPEVLVSQAETRGLHRLIALAGQGDPSLGVLLAPRQEPAPIIPLEHGDILIAPITPLEPLATDSY